jgi:cell division transport system permease protein
MRLKLILSESMRSLGANISTTVAASMTVLIGMFLLGLSISLSTWLSSWSQNVQDKLVINVYYDNDVAAARINAVRAQLDADPRVKSIEFVSRAEALKIMRKRFPEATESLSANPLPPAHKVTPFDANQLESITASLTPPPAGVEKVTYGKQRTEQVLGYLDVIEWAVRLAVVILLVASAMLIANTIRLSIFSRRREVEVMKLVGATNWFVRGPFMVEGLLCGLAGAVGAVFLLWLGKVLLIERIPQITNEDEVHALQFSLVGLIVLGLGLGLGALASGVTLRRFLDV